jgi:valyl-tRNA synthetase
MLNMLDAKAQIQQTADGLIPDDLLGIDRFWARKLVVERLKEGGLLVPHIDKDGVEHDAEPRTIQTPYGDRSGDVIEPWLTDQWYVDAETLAKAPIEAVRDGRIKIVPKSWEKTFFNWMENIQPWCVSRQLWWGHRIPAWFGPSLESPDERKIFVAHDEEGAIQQAYDYYQSAWREGTGMAVQIVADEAKSRDLRMDDQIKWFGIWQDPDVLDTWFSSALWPFATMGWPEESPSRSREGLGEGVSANDALTSTSPPPTPPAGGRGERQLHGRYPNDVLISGFDILFFWDARMMMQGMHFMGDVPFRTLYLHGLVRAADGQKMSKSKGNVVNPLGLIDQYGADALRFFMAAMESQGRDIKMDEKRVEGYRNFATKLWNAARFCQSNGIGASKTVEAPAATLAVNKWIIGETIQTVQAVDLALADYRFDGAANAIYQFAWSRFCDWYLELIKPLLSGGEQVAIDETRIVAGWVLDQILVMLHPFMPFVTEELWSKLGDRDYDLIIAKWPIADAHALDPQAIDEVEWLIRLVSGIRAARTDLNVPPGEQLALHVVELGPDAGLRVSKHSATLKRLARAVPTNGQFVGAAAYVVSDGATYALPLEGVIDLAAERTRLTKAIEAAAKERDGLAGRLNNPSFVERAKPEAVEKARADHAEKSAEAERLTAALARLG